MGLIRALLERLTLRLVLYWGALIGGAWLFAELADEVYEGSGLFFDTPVLTWMHAVRHPLLDRLMIALSVLGDVWPMLVIALVGTAICWRVQRSEGAFFALSMIGTLVITAITKYLLGRGRPELFADPTLWAETTPSFPSGHAAGSFALFLTVFLVTRRRARWRLALALLSGLFALGVTLSRVYLQIHYPSDVLASWALGAAWVLGLNYLFARDRSTRTVLLSLNRDTVERYREAARGEGVSEAEFVEKALGERLAQLHQRGATRADDGR